MLKFISCGTRPIRRIAAERCGATSMPNTSTLPELALTSELTTPISVDLPAPLGPSRAKKSPGSTLQRHALERLDAVVVDLAQVGDVQGGDD